MSRITFEVLPDFQKDLKMLAKRYRSLDHDLQVLIKDLNDEPGSSPPFSYRIEGLGIVTCIIKVRKIACKSLKGRGVNSGLRLIYAYFEVEKRIVMIELYHKSDKSGEDRKRITDHFK